ncbi:hypothetical protein N2152v2_000678 [Parachlorella kessleri]
MRQGLQRLLLSAAPLASTRGQAVRAVAQAEAAAHQQWRRQYSTEGEEEKRDPLANERVVKLADEIIKLSLLDVSDLTEVLRKKLNIPNAGFMPMGMQMGMPMQAAAPAGGAGASPAEPPKEEKTEFDIKLEGFDAAAKIKVIKEIRGITDLGLKEAKELVEGSPTVVKKGLKKEEAEEIKKKLEAGSLERGAANSQEAPMRTQGDELQALRQRILEKQAQLREARPAGQAVRAADREQLKQERRQRLQSSFAKALADADLAGVAEVVSSKASVSYADEYEVQRVLRCTSDYEVLKLQPGVDTVNIKRRYREMAVVLHPDKCRAPHATDAFQRLVRAYQSLLQFAR